MSILSYIVWSINPDIFVIPGMDHPVRWYGLLFAGGFIVSQQIMYFVYKKEGKPEKDIDILTVHMIIATVLGARLGHCLFYDPIYYLSNPLEILKIWEGGLASHGGAIGIFISVWLYSNYDIRVKLFPIIKGLLSIPVSFKGKKKKRDGQSFAWVLDRLVIVVAITGALIRTGNFMNSEMIGIPTESDYGIVFGREAEASFLAANRNIESVEFKKGKGRENYKDGYVPVNITFHYKRDADFNEAYVTSYFQTSIKNYLSRPRDEQHIFTPADEPMQISISQKDRHYIVEAKVFGVSRHPAQLYEAFYCILLFLGLFHLWYHYRQKMPEGFMIGLFLASLFSLRFIDEFFKINQVGFEENIPLNMGQWLSIPFILIGTFVMIRSFRNKKTMSA